jgi:hypothetical protein
MLLLAYFAFAWVRKMLLILYSFTCASNPIQHYHVGWMACICMDVLIIPALFVYCIVVYQDQPYYQTKSFLTENNRANICFQKTPNTELTYYSWFMIWAGLIYGGMNVMASACVCCCVCLGGFCM